jgi:IclR family transcriptional regulator, acetate operon repressor
VEDLVGTSLVQRTSGTFDKVQDLIRHLAQVRKRHVATDIEEHAQGVCGLGVVVHTGQPELYAISLAVPALRFKTNIEALHTALLQCKAEIEASMKTARNR